MDYSDMDKFVRLSDLVYNRVGIFNEILGCRYQHANDNPMRVDMRRGLYRVTFGDSLVSEYRVWDVSSAESCYNVVNAWCDCIWQIRRTGSLSLSV